MSKKKIIIVPIGGLANRMRAIASAVSLAHNTGRALKIIWHRNSELNAPFHTLFSTPENDFKTLDLEIEEITDLKYRLIYEIPRKKNLFIPQLTNIFSNCVWIRHIGLDTSGWITDKKLMNLCRDKKYSDKDIIITSGSVFFPFKDSELRKIFIPAKRVEEKKKEILRAMVPEIGLHIRRTDNRLSIQNSPISLFTQVVDSKLEQSPESIFYLATDSQEVKEFMKEKYGDSIVTNKAEALRDSENGMIDAYAEMLILSQCDIIYGSFWSSFSEIAASLGDKKLMILKQQ